MFSPPSNALTSFPVVCLILVLAKISLYFVVKYSLGMTYIFCSFLNSPLTLATLFQKSTAFTGF